MTSSSWKKCKISDIKAPISHSLVGGPFGSNLVSHDYTPSGIPVIRGQNMGFGRWIGGEFVFISQQKAEKLSANIARPHDLIFTQRGTIGQVSVVPDKPYHEYVISQSQMKVTVDNSKTDVIFLYYLFNTSEQQEYIKQNAIQTGVPHTNLEHLRNTPIILPPLSEQKKIARILGSLDDKIELNRQMNETLEAMARAIFKSWFVDFDPVRAKADGRDTGLPSDIAALFPDGFEDIDGREVPNRWKITNVENIAEKVGMGPFGSSIKVETFVTEGMPIISGTHLQNFMLDDTTFNFISHDHAEKLKNSLVYRGDIIFTHAGNIGQAALIPENSRYEQYILSQRQFFLRPDQKQLSPSYLAFFFTSTEGKDLLLANASSSGVPSIARPVTYLRSIPILVPPRNIIDDFEKLVRPLNLKYRINIEQSRTLAQMRDALLPKLMNGDIRVEYMA